METTQKNEGAETTAPDSQAQITNLPAQNQNLPDHLKDIFPVNSKFPVEVTLPVSGTKVKIHHYNTRHQLEAWEISKSNRALFTSAIIALCCSFNGRPLMAEDIYEHMPATDYQFLSDKFSEYGLL